MISSVPERSKVVVCDPVAQTEPSAPELVLMSTERPVWEVPPPTERPRTALYVGQSVEVPMV